MQGETELRETDQKAEMGRGMGGEARRKGWRKREERRMSINGRWAEEEKGRSRRRFSLFFFSQRQRERRQTEG